MAEQVHRREDADVIAGADAAVAAVVTLEGAAHGLRHHDGWGVVDAEFVFQRDVENGEVLQMHVLAGTDRPRRIADDLAVFQNGRAFRDGRERDLVPARNALGGGEAIHQRAAGVDIGGHDPDIVFRVEDKHGGQIGKHGGSSNGSAHYALCRQKSIFGIICAGTGERHGLRR